MTLEEKAMTLAADYLQFMKDKHKMTILAPTVEEVSKDSALVYWQAPNFFLDLTVRESFISFTYSKNGDRIAGRYLNYLDKPNGIIAEMLTALNVDKM